MKIPTYIVWVVVQFMLTFIASSMKDWYHQLYKIQNDATGDEKTAAIPNNQRQNADILVPPKISSSTSTLTNLNAADFTTPDLNVFVSVSDGGMGYHGKCNCPKPDRCDDETEERLRLHLGFSVTCSCLLLIQFVWVSVVYLDFRSRYY